MSMYPFWFDKLLAFFDSLFLWGRGQRWRVTPRAVCELPQCCPVGG